MWTNIKLVEDRLCLASKERKVDPNKNFLKMNLMRIVLKHKKLYKLLSITCLIISKTFKINRVL